MTLEVQDGSTVNGRFVPLPTLLKDSVRLSVTSASTKGCLVSVYFYVETYTAS